MVENMHNNFISSSYIKTRISEPEESWEILSGSGKQIKECGTSTSLRTKGGAANSSLSDNRIQIHTCHNILNLSFRCNPLGKVIRSAHTVSTCSRVDDFSIMSSRHRDSGRSFRPSLCNCSITSNISSSYNVVNLILNDSILYVASEFNKASWGNSWEGWIITSTQPY